MKFTLIPDQRLYTDEERTELEEMGVRFELSPTGRVWVHWHDAYVEINTFEELLAFIQKWEQVLIRWDDNEFTIKIHDSTCC